jgi:soluble lytic murein transglycosylase-like protein
MAGMSRKQCVWNGGGCSFSVANNPNANGNAPWYEIGAFSQVDQYSRIIDRIALQTGVDGDLIRAIMYMETTHGYYDSPLAMIGANQSILPMNINIFAWAGYGDWGSREQMSNPVYNILAGAEILAGIQANMAPGASIAQIATLYNNLNASMVSNYGARVQSIYNSKPW